MAKKTDPETGAQTRATDGDPDREFQQEMDELAAARAKAQAEAGGGGNGGRVIDDQPDAGQEDDGQLFIYEGDRKVSLGSLIPRGKPVEHAVKFGTARRKGQGGLIGFEEDVLLVVRGKVASVKPLVTRNDDESVKSVTIETEVTPKVIVAADSEEAMALLAGVLEKRRPKAA